MSVIIRLLYRKVAVPKENLIGLIEQVDANNDGYVTLEEIANLLKAYSASVRKAQKYIKRKG